MTDIFNPLNPSDLFSPNSSADWAATINEKLWRKVDDLKILAAKFS